MKIVFVRHGDPDYVNDTLTEKGEREAQILADRMKNYKDAEFFVSPLGRARKTAQYTEEKIGVKCEVLDFLEEFSGFVLDPKTNKPRIPWDQMPSYWTADERFYDKNEWLKTDLMKSGNVEEIYKDVCAKFDKLLADHGYCREGNYYKAVKPNEDTLVFFCHFGITSVLMSHLLGVSPYILWQGFVALTTSVTTLATEEREKGIAYFRCNGFGDISHLNGAGEQPSFSARYCEVFKENE